MNIEEKARAYDKALEQAKKELAVSSPNSDSARQIFRFFPKLKESEDERIRNKLIELVGCFRSRGIDQQLCEQFLAYLEKQKEQKPAEWNEDYNEENIQTRFAFYTYKDEPSTLYLSNVFVEESSRNHGFGTRILKAAEKVAEAIGAITISLKVKQNSPANAWYRKSGYGYVSFEDGYDWLEKNLEYMKPNKQEWSEEDADMLNCCISSIEEAKENRYAYNETDGDTSYDREIAWLKLLRNRVGKEFLQPHWKPSEEQLLQLRCVISGCPYDTDPLVLLEQQLKNL